MSHDLRESGTPPSGAVSTGSWAVGLALATLLGVGLVGCAGDEQRVVGSVVAVDGDLSGVVAFELQTERGRMRFEPNPGLVRFSDPGPDGGAPLTHLFDHLRDGHPVRVTYRVEDGVNVAIRLEDA